MYWKKLYVGNLNYDTNEESLQAAFSQYGDVKRVMIVTDRDTGKSRGFGFVTLATPEEADTAMAALDGQDLDGRPLRISEARERERRK